MIHLRDKFYTDKLGLHIQTPVRIPRHLFCLDTESPHLVRIPNPDVIDGPYTETPVYIFLSLWLDTESTLVTLSEVLKSAKDLKDSAERLEMKLNQTDRQVALEQGKLKSLISKIQEELHIGKSSHFYDNSKTTTSKMGLQA